MSSKENAEQLMLLEVTVIKLLKVVPMPTSQYALLHFLLPIMLL